ncbi:unnamed protein product, partial [marine sediment metagenome]
LNRISENFARVLTGVFHSRVKYPKTKKEGEGSEDSSKDKSPPEEGKPEEDKETG